MLVVVSNGLSSLLSVAVAPESVYEPPSSTVTGLSPIIVIIGSVSFDYLFSPVITGSIIIIIFAIIINRLILKKSYPSFK